LIGSLKKKLFDVVQIISWFYKILLFVMRVTMYCEYVVKGASRQLSLLIFFLSLPTVCSGSESMKRVYIISRVINSFFVRDTCFCHFVRFYITRISIYLGIYCRNWIIGV